ncbi:MAG: rhomboid family intramembrane serine protease [Bacteroidota bacterium]|nr:MAG: rhomboid family intramembrane serine protease [Bacteroidota bacterium]
MFPLFYLSALVVSSLPDYLKHKDHSWYRSLGASGAVAAVMFSYIVFDPGLNCALILYFQFRPSCLR